MTRAHMRDEVASATAPEVVAGTVIAGRYRVLEEIERFGAHAGYRVRHTLLDSLLVLTTLPGELVAQAGFLARVRAAVREAGQLRHDHILPVLDLVEHGDRYFLVEPFVDAVPLERMIREEPLSPPDALRVARQLADALAYAHEHAVVHGALSPAHVLIERGRPPRAVLGGFGLAALPPPAPAYTAPERAAGAEVDACTDIFTLGLLVFELFEGRPLLSGTAREVEALLRGTAPLVPRFAGMVPAGVPALVARAVRRTPGARQQKMSHVRAEIDACLRAVGEGPEGAAAAAGAAPALADAAPSARAGAEEPASVIDLEAIVSDRPAEPGPAPAAAAPAAVGTRPVRRSFWPRRTRRQPTMSGRVLLRVSEPRRTPIGVRVATAGMVLALGWPILRWNAPTAGVGTAGGQRVEAGARASAAPGAVASIAAPASTGTAPARTADAGSADPAPEQRTSGQGRSLRIVVAQPARRDRVSVPGGRAVDFAVRAIGGDADDPVAYTWLLDGRRVGAGRSWRFVAPSVSEPRALTVEVQAATEAGLEAPATAWTVDVRPAPAARPRVAGPGPRAKQGTRIAGRR